MQRFVSPVLCFSVAAVLSACNTGVEMGGGADMRPPADIRNSPGNTVMGTVCDDTRACGRTPRP